MESREIRFRRLEHLGHLQTIRIRKIDFHLLNLSFSGVRSELRGQNGSPKILKTHAGTTRTLTCTTSIIAFIIINILLLYYLHHIRVVQALLPQQLHRQLPLPVSPPRRLDEVGPPCPPLVGIVAEGVLQLLAVESLELVRHEF